MAKSKNIPTNVINQLIEFYEISNGIPCLDSFEFHSCNDKILYEWWNRQELWLGTRDMDILRWSKGRFCLGDASNTSYGRDYEFTSLIDLLEKAFLEWGL